MLHTQSGLVKNYDCIDSHHLNVTENCFEDCKDACVSISFNTDTSLSKWPQPSQYDSFYEQIIAPRPFADKFRSLFDKSGFVDKKDKAQMMDDHFLYIEFVMDWSTPYFEMVEVPRYTLFSMLGSLGGGLNWLTGITVLVFIELLESCINIGKRCLNGEKVGNEKATKEGATFRSEQY